MYLQSKKNGKTEAWWFVNSVNQLMWIKLHVSLESCQHVRNVGGNMRHPVLLRVAISHVDKLVALLIAGISRFFVKWSDYEKYIEENYRIIKKYDALTRSVDCELLRREGSKL